MKRTFILTLLTILVITPFCACKKVSRDTDSNYPKPERYKMKLTIGNKTFTATLDVNASADAFRAQLPLTLDMTDYGGFEKIYKLDVKLPYNDKLEESLGLGDIMLYQSNTIVLFYDNHGGFSYSRIGKIDNTLGLREALGTGNVTVKWENIK